LDAVVLPRSSNQLLLEFFQRVGALRAHLVVAQVNERVYQRSQQAWLNVNLIALSLLLDLVDDCLNYLVNEAVDNRHLELLHALVI
jgi:hypothetical protein